MTKFERPSLVDIHGLLRKRQSLIVHFSGTPKGAGSPFNHRYPEDLNEVLRGHCMSGLSTSVVSPSDNFADDQGANATGFIGVVLGLQSPDSIVDAKPGDCGSSMREGVRHVDHLRDLTIANLEETIADRESNSYNEWVIADYKVIGILAIEPYRVSIVKDCAGIEVPDFDHLDLNVVKNTFPNLRIFSFSSGGLVELIKGVLTPVQHSELYSEKA